MSVIGVRVLLDRRDLVDKSAPEPTCWTPITLTAWSK